jgi:hypothetical protein
VNSELRLVVFFLELPEPLPIVSGTTISVVTDERLPELEDLSLRVVPGGAALPDVSGNVFVSFRFWQVDASHLTPPPYLEATFEVIRRLLPPHLHAREGAGRRGPQFASYRTVVEAVTPFRWGPDKDKSQDELTAAFDRCESNLAELVDAYRSYKHSYIQPLRRELLPLAVPFVTRDILREDSWDEHISYFLLHLSLPVGEELLDLSQMQKVLLTHTLRMRGNPFVTYSLRSTEASSALSRYGNAADAVIRAQMSFEVLIDGLLACMLWEEGVDPIDAAQRFFVEGLTKRVRTHYAPRLGGNWSTEGGGPMAQWSENVHQLRGRVVHANYVPTRVEAGRALDAMEVVDSFVRERLVARRAKYKRTTLMLLGRPGLEKRGAWSGQIRRFAETRAGSEPDWLASLSEWRTRLNGAR